ncbi:ABC transporter ATP-binding protein [Spirochaeta africana]|uniref:ABC-type multidrug transport system, ATPase component n=1 Tax=Spirochaeta africana (strain ATCC 700263 / DSM 8902 / Z-7692) TaxID=889378 RepID=H9UHX3_SPIAZ|nr:ABC transporter ATP-binding protein [Spirochaeta africana]AFG37116.1 ABC-type multidrug transport system, ATPase component [Spirochaeta africana DSM 8902]
MSEYLIEVQGLGYRYSGASRDAVTGLGFAVLPGQIYGFLGPSGAGKSTTQKILYRLLPDYEGSVRLFGREVRDWDGALYDRLGIGFETPNLYAKLTGRENLQFALSMRREAGGAAADIGSAAERLGLGAALDSLTDTYSKGMRMRLAFLRAVLHRPPLLFLDEPTSGLDPLWAREVKDWILELRAAGTAIFLTTHSMELADELCDTVGFLADGQLVLQEPPDELKRRFGKPGVIVSGRDAAGAGLDIEVGYDDLLQQDLRARYGLQEISRVCNREVSLEEVFLQVTGQRLIPAGEGGS